MRGEERERERERERESEFVTEEGQGPMLTLAGPRPGVHNQVVLASVCPTSVGISRPR